jgi:hypothetical protein
MAIMATATYAEFESCDIRRKRNSLSFFNSVSVTRCNGHGIDNRIIHWPVALDEMQRLKRFRKLLRAGDNLPRAARLVLHSLSLTSSPAGRALTM